MKNSEVRTEALKQRKKNAKIIENSKFGFAMAEGSFEQGAIVSLRDLLALYMKDSMSTSLSIDKVASPIFSMPHSSALREVLTEMFRQRFRRIFLEGNGKMT
jgi:signal-transduction protein with cAMP-binding, CBS, and nucleotidyltransferase domain